MVFRVGRPTACAVLAATFLPHVPAAAQIGGPPAPAIQSAEAASPSLDSDAPLDAMPDIGVDWPDLGPPATTAATASPATTSAESDNVPYGWRLDGIDGIGTALFRQRFAELSALDAHDGEPANAAQLARRAREDAELVQTLLRAQGYYDAQVTTAIEPGRRPTVVLTAHPGALYRFAEVRLNGIGAAGVQETALTRAFAVRPGDPVDADAVVAGEAALRTAAGRQGFAFARVGEPELVIDRAAHTAELTIGVETGRPTRFGRIVALPGNRVFAPDHVVDIARFRTGDPYDAAALEDLRRALVQTSLVSAVELKPVASADPALVDIGVRLDPAPPRTIAGELGYGTGEGARAELSWTHRNLFPPEGALTLRGVVGTREQLGSVIFRRSNAGGRDRVLTTQTAVSHTRRDAYEAKTFLLAGTMERQSTIFFQKTWTWSLGGELVASDEHDVELSTGLPRRRTFFIAAAPVSLGYDGTDDLLNPSTGVRLSGRASPELSLQGRAFGYTRMQVDTSGYLPLHERVVLAGRARLGTIVGAPRAQIAPSRRFYAGGGASVRGYGYQSIGPRDPDNDPVGGRSLAELSVEARIRLFGSFGLVPFLDAGNIYTSSVPRLSEMRFGTGLGVRYYSSFGPIRLDIGTPINPQRGDSRIAVYVSLGQAF